MIIKTNSCLCMNEIIKKQNQDYSIARLRAQRFLYSQAKKWNFGMFVACVVLVASLGVVKCHYPLVLWLTILVPVYSAFAVFVKCYGDNVVTKKKDLAARIQQLFETELFGVDWNPQWGDRPTIDEVTENSKCQSADGLYNWFDEQIEKVDQQRGILLCQMECCYYDYKVREYFYRGCTIVFIILVISLIGMGCVGDFKLVDFLMNVILPILPICIWYYRIYNGYRRDKARLSKMESVAELSWKNAVRKKGVSKKDTDSLQSILFEHRKYCYLVPDWVYSLCRKKREEHAYYSTKDRIDELRRSGILEN